MNPKLNKKHTCLTAAALAVSLGLMGNSAMAAGEGLVKVKAMFGLTVVESKRACFR